MRYQRPQRRKAIDNPEMHPGDGGFKSEKTRDRYVQQTVKQHAWLSLKVKEAKDEEARKLCLAKLEKWYANHPQFVRAYAIAKGAQLAKKALNASEATQ